MIKVASYNIHKAVGTDRRRSPARILEVLNEIGADIVALQEADLRFGTRRSALPVDLIEHGGKYRPVPFETRKHSIGWHGNAILVSPRVDVIHHDIIPIPSLEPRGAVVADLRTTLGAVRIVGMHLDLSGLWRRRQIRFVLEHLAARNDKMPVIMMGDLNEWSRIGGCLKELPHDFCVAPCAPSFHARRPVAHLDRIIVGPKLKIIDSNTHHSHMARQASDHLPIWAELSL